MFLKKSPKTPKTEVMAAENSSFPPEEQIKFLNILEYKTGILNCNNISQYYCSYFFIK